MLVVVSLVAMGGLWTAGKAVSDVSNETDVTATVAQSPTWQGVGGPTNTTRYADPVVTNSTGELDTTQYSWNHTEGEIYFAENTSDNATVETVALDTPPDAAPVLQTLDFLFKIPTWLVLIAAVAVLLAAVRAVNSVTSRGGPI